MINGHDKQVSINPQQAASFALQFLDGVPHTRAQRDQYDIAVGLLTAIVSGQVILSPPNAMPELTAEPPAATQ